MKTAHDIGPGMARISLTITEHEKRAMQKLAEASNLSLNAYINAILTDVIEHEPIVIMRPQIIREPRAEYGEKQHKKKIEKVDTSY